MSFTDANFTYTIITGTSNVSVAKQNDATPSGIVTIPSTVTNGSSTYNVTTIGNSVFKDCSSLTSIVIPDSVTTIEEYAFVNCYSLATVTIGISVTTIGDGAFRSCSLATLLFRGNTLSITSLATNLFFNVGSNATRTITFWYTTNDGTEDGGINSSLLGQVKGITDNKVVYPIGDTTSGAQIFRDPNCFAFDTKILTVTDSGKEMYVPIQELKQGDLVKTYNDTPKKIRYVSKSTIRNGGENKKLRLYKKVKTESNGLLEDLTMTGAHALLLDEKDSEFKNRKFIHKFGNYGSKKIHDKCLMKCGLSPDFEEVQDTEEHPVYHVLLENEKGEVEIYGIWANGVLVESCKS